MNRIVILAVVACALTSACTVRSERTVVEKPVPSSAAVVVPSDSSQTTYVVHRD